MDCSLPSMGFFRQEYWSMLPFISPGDLPNSGIKPVSPTLQAESLLSEPPGKGSFFKKKKERKKKNCVKKIIGNELKTLRKHTFLKCEVTLTLVRVALLCRDSSKVSWLRITYSLIYGSNSEWLGHGVCFNGYLSQHYRYCFFVHQQTHLNWKHSWTREFQGEKTNRLHKEREYGTVKRQRDKKEKKSEEKERCFAIYQDRSIYIQFHTKKKKKQQMFLFHILFLCVACLFSPLGIP